MRWPLQYQCVALVVLLGIRSSLSSSNKSDRDAPRLRRASAIEQAQEIETIPTKRVIVTCRPGMEAKCREELSSFSVVEELKGTDFFAVEVEDEEAIWQLDHVINVEQDPPRYIIGFEENDEDDTNGRYLAQEVPYGIDMVAARQFWETHRNKGSQATVCVIDTGLVRGHEDFDYTNIAGTDTGYQEGGNWFGGGGYVYREWDEDQSGHGTHVAGTVAAVDNGKGVVGVCPECRLHIIRVFDQGGFFGSNLVAALNNCTNANVDVISMSLGGGGSSSAEQNAIQNAINRGIVVVAASGNSGNWQQGISGPIEYPAGYSQVMGIGSVGSNKILSSFSTYGSHVSVTAPGSNVRSVSIDGSDQYVRLSGTSMATPHVAGVAGLLRSLDRANKAGTNRPLASPQRLREIIEESADRDITNYNVAMYGAGIVNVLRASELLLEDDPPPPPPSCVNDCLPALVRITVDRYGNEITWTVTDSSGATRRAGGPYEDTTNGDIMEDTFELSPDDCYTFTLNDSYGDGICCGYGNGVYRLEFDGELVVESNDFGNVAGEDRSTRQHSFGSGCEDGDEEEEQNPVCGNGSLDASNGEECDLGDLNSNQGECTLDCKINQCGDGHVYEGVEQCDDGPNNSDTSSCKSDCTWNTCGDGHVNEGAEECDNGIGGNIDSGSCTSNCQLNICGDGHLHEGVEECDEASNNSDSAYCTLDCKINVCGDGNVYDGVEECDDGAANNLNTTPCTPECKINVCGDNMVNSGVEECDEGASNNADNALCTSECLWNVCGDGKLHDGVEQCDDGNLVDGDGCSSDCFVEEWRMEVLTDNYPAESTWEIINLSNNAQVVSGGPYPTANTAFESFFSLPDPSACYKLIFRDSYGDGICCGYGEGEYRLWHEASTEPVVENTEFGNEGPSFSRTQREHLFGLSPSCFPAQPECGNGIVEDGEACDDGPNNGEAAACGLDCQWNEADTLSVVLSIRTDNYPTETSWRILDASDGNELMSVSTSTYLERNTLYAEEINDLPATGCYILEMNDSYGDGMCCAYGSGFYTLTMGSDVVVENTSFGSSTATHSFGPGCPSTEGQDSTCDPDSQVEFEIEILGDADSLAQNSYQLYDALDSSSPFLWNVGLGSVPSNTLTTDSICLPKGGCTTFEFYDAIAYNGLQAPGYLKAFQDGELVMEVGPATYEYVFSVQIGDGCS